MASALLVLFAVPAAASLQAFRPTSMAGRGLSRPAKRMPAVVDVAVAASLQQETQPTLAEKYAQLSAQYYLPIACVQSGCLRGSSDLVGQTLRGAAHLDFGHAAAMATVGILFSGLVGASWLRTLETTLGSGTQPRDVVTKAAADYCLYAPVANSAYLFFVPLLTALFSGTLSSVDVAHTCTLGSCESWQHNFPAAMQLELAVFAPYNLLSFRLIPANYRPQATAAACAGFTVALSALC